jgi:hypothetical protein
LLVARQLVGEASMMIEFEGFARRVPGRNMTKAVAIQTLDWVTTRDNPVGHGKGN